MTDKLKAAVLELAAQPYGAGARVVLPGFPNGVAEVVHRVPSSVLIRVEEKPGAKPRFFEVAV